MKPEYAKRNARTPEELTDEQRRRVIQLVENGGFDTAKKTQQLSVPECIFGFQHEHRLKLGKVQRSTAPQRSAKPAPAVTAPAAFSEPKITDAEMEQIRLRAIAAIL